MNNLKLYLPKIYEKVAETNALMETENIEFEELENNITIIRNNFYPSLADEKGIAIYERGMGIIPNPTTENLDFRRNRVLNRLSMTPPFTLQFLADKLDEIIGVNKWKMVMDFNTYTLYIESSAVNQNWFSEVQITVNRLKPANIVFINNPFLAAEIGINESISLTEFIYNYRLGTTWVLGKEPFTKIKDKGVIKMADLPSITQKMLEKVATFGAEDIAKARVNGTHVINDFLEKTATGNKLTVKYKILNNLFNSVTKLELLDSANNILSSSVVFFPLTEETIITHNLTIKEA